VNSDVAATANFVEDRFTDARDGKTYRRVKIGQQMWMAENLNYQTDSSWCYDNDPANCAKYGRLYAWNAAMAGSPSSNSSPSGVQGACPVGWHLPSGGENVYYEWNTLIAAVDGGSLGGSSATAGTMLKAKSPDWDGTDDFGFSALPGGYRDAYNGTFRELGTHGRWWTATENKEYGAFFLWMTGSQHMFDSKGYGMSVRCVQDRN
jgi:uncharacterized protein (TIGR02145 family)